MEDTRSSLPQTPSPLPNSGPSTLPDDLDALLVGLISTANSLALSRFGVDRVLTDRPVTVCRDCGLHQPAYGKHAHSATCRVGAVLNRIAQLEEYFEQKRASREFDPFTDFQGPIGMVGEQILVAQDEQARQATMQGLSEAIDTYRSAVDQADGFGEPWATAALGEDVTVATVDGRIAVDMIGSDMVLDDEAIYARRIAACVNFCVGLPTEELATRRLIDYRPDMQAIAGKPQPVPTLVEQVSAVCERVQGVPMHTEADCTYCGPVCYGGAAHNARVEDGAVYGSLPGEWPAAAPVAVEGGAQ